MRLLLLLLSVTIITTIIIVFLLFFLLDVIFSCIFLRALKKVWGFSQLHAHSLERLEHREGVAVYKEAR